MPATTEEALEANIAAGGIDRAASADTYAMPATQGQVRFWSLDSLNPGNPALNMPLMWQCTGPLDIPVLRDAFARCVARHESLRTTFRVIDGSLRQIIHPAMSVPLPVDDLSGLAGETQRLEADRLTREHAAFRFDLDSGPLLVLRLLRLDAESHLLLVTMHHIICDGISNGVLMRDMEAIYEGNLHGTTAVLPELPIQFADYAVWHEDWRRSEEHEASLAFWHRTLGQTFHPIQLPHDPDAPAALPEHLKDSTGAIDTLLLPPDLTARAHAFCAREGVTLNVLLFSVFCALLNRITGQRDLAIGSPCANRGEGTEDLIGLFMNIQVLRVKLTEDSSFRDLLRQVNTWTLAASEHQPLMFEDLVHDPFFSGGDHGEQALEIPIFFLYQKSFMLIRRIESAAGSLQIVPLRSESPGAVFEVMFAVVDRDEEGPRLQLEYNPQYFKTGTIANYLRLFVQLLESALNDADLAVTRLRLLSAPAQETLLAQEERTGVDFGAFDSVPSMFLRRAGLFPAAPAVSCDGATWTHAALAARTRQIAAELLTRGLRPGATVAIGVRRSPDMLAAVLGVMLAGGAYVPLDPRHPRTRLQHVLEDSGAAFLLTDSDLPAGTKADVVRLDRLEAAGTTASPPAFPDLQANRLAYVIYTSGSTGKPKGVEIEHGSLVNLLRAMEREPGLTSADTLVAVTTLAFDIATLELLLPLLTGAHLVIATEKQAADPAALLALLHATQATVLQATPGAWRALLDTCGAASLPLRAWCGGEAMSRDLADRLLRCTEAAWNMYGPTETTIWSSATRVTAGTAIPRIGAPVANTQFYILDENRQPLPAGLSGELFIGGAGLARGYHNRPEQTAAAFIANPFGSGRLYKTGDLARRHEDGTLQLLGRADFQVKVRGYRIELGEIEHELEQHARVGEAVVMYHVAPDELHLAKITRLVAYVAAGAEAAKPEAAAALIEELRTHLRASLPDYMMPNAFMVLDQLPRTPNGKVDRKALPEVFDTAGDAGLSQSPGATDDFVAPRDILERQLAEIWSSTLRIPRISVRAGFFSLGVGSLAALRLITRMNRVYGLDLGLASLISASSIESIAALIRNRLFSAVTSSLVSLKASGSRPPLFMVHGVGGNVINLYGLATRMDPEQPVYGIQSQALLAGQPALLRLEDMAAFYLREVRTVQPHGPYRLLGYSFGGTVALEMARQLRAAGEDVALLAMLDSRTRDYERGLRSRLTMGDRVDRRVQRARRNTAKLSPGDLARYFAGKVNTRAVRFASMFGGSLGLRELPAFMKSAWDINHAALERYSPARYEGRLLLFRATEQEYSGGTADLGWASLFSGGVDVREIEGDHERIFLEPNIDELAVQLRAVLAEVAA